MNLYDEQITQALTLINPEKQRHISLKGDPWEDVGQQNLVLRREMAFELGAGTLPAISFLGITSDEMLIPEDAVILDGHELNEIASDMPFARITLIRVNHELLDSGTAIYDTVRRFVHTRYSVNPKGYMSRISTGCEHEPIRISKQALDEGLDFSKVARLYMDAYKKHPGVVAVKVFFITRPDFNYSQLLQLTRKNEQITSALDHLLRDINMDCSTCKLQALCDEVEGLKALHFK